VIKTFVWCKPNDNYEISQYCYILKLINCAGLSQHSHSTSGTSNHLQVSKLSWFVTHHPGPLSGPFFLTVVSVYAPVGLGVTDMDIASTYESLTSVPVSRIHFFQTTKVFYNIFLNWHDRCLQKLVMCSTLGKLICYTLNLQSNKY